MLKKQNKTKQNKTKQQRKKKTKTVYIAKSATLRKNKKQEKTIKTRILGVNSLFLFFWHSSANSVSISVY